MRSICDLWYNAEFFTNEFIRSIIAIKQHPYLSYLTRLNSKIQKLSDKACI